MRQYLASVLRHLADRLDPPLFGLPMPQRGDLHVVVVPSSPVAHDREAA